MVSRLIHVIQLDDRTGLSKSMGETVLVAGNGCEPVLGVPHERAR